MFCWYFKYLISRAADSDRQLSQRTKKHIEHCESCRSFYTLCRSMEAGLREQAESTDSKLSSRLRQRIIDSVSEKKVKTHKVGLRFRPVLAAAAVIAVVLAGIFVFNLNQENKEPDVHIVHADSARIQDLVKGIYSSNLPGMVENPLAVEMDNLEEDTKSAVKFLIDCVSIRINQPRRN